MTVDVGGTSSSVMAVKDGRIRHSFGRIVCAASIASLAPRGTLLPYSTLKAVVIAFAPSCAQTFAPDVRVSCLAPGLIEIDMSAAMDEATREAMSEAAFPKRAHRPARRNAQWLKRLIRKDSSPRLPRPRRSL